MGHPQDPAIRQELLSALEWDASLRPDHARSTIRELFREVHDHSLDLAKHLQSAGDAASNGYHHVAHGIERLRKSLGALKHVLATRHDPPPKA
jgi:hypothetical protein